MCKAEDIKVDGKFLVNYTDMGKQIMIADNRTPLSWAGKEWLIQYFKEFDLDIRDMTSMSCRQVFCFGPGRRYVSKEMIEVLIVVEGTN